MLQLKNVLSSSLLKLIVGACQRIHNVFLTDVNHYVNIFAIQQDFCASFWIIV